MGAKKRVKKKSVVRGWRVNEETIGDILDALGDVLEQEFHDEVVKITIEGPARFPIKETP